MSTIYRCKYCGEEPEVDLYVDDDGGCVWVVDCKCHPKAFSADKIYKAMEKWNDGNI